MTSYDHRSKTSKPMVYFWESLIDKERAKGRAAYVLEPIEKYHREATRILEIGCGIGEVLVNLPIKYSISGVDIGADYIEVCRRRMPKGRFYVSSMHNFRIDEKFDAIFSADDAVNFLKDFSQWRSTFKAVSEHLDLDGLFIFDVFTPKMLSYTRRWWKNHDRTYLSGKEFEGGYSFDRGVAKGTALTWEFSIFEKLPSSLYQLNEYAFRERIYPVARMKSALSKRFDILEASPREDGRVVLFVCRKKRSTSP
jgi:SAM-dependent methyltransferase